MTTKNYKTDAGAARPQHDRKPLSGPRTVRADDLERVARAVLDGAKLAGIDRAILTVRMCGLRGGNPDRYDTLDDRDLAKAYLDAREVEHARERKAAGLTTTKIAEPDDEAKALAAYKARASQAWRSNDDE